MASQQPPVASPDQPINIKVQIDGTNRRFKLPLRDLSVSTFSIKIRDLLQIPADQLLLLERYSDSSGTFVPVDARNYSSYKQLHRAAKAKGRLRLRASHVPAVPQVPMDSAATIEPASAVKAEELPAESVCAEEKKPSVEAPEHVQHAGAPRLPSLSQILSEVTETSKPTAEKTQQESAPSSTAKPNTAANHCKSFSQEGFFNWQVCCNNCDKQVTTEHYHCSICDGGDYDLCDSCVKAGAVCGGDGHWMIKRTLQNGDFVSSTTKTVASKPKDVAPPASSMPGSFSIESKSAPSNKMDERICNSCIRHLPQKMVISCKDCPDYDLCMPCLVDNKHGHHPGHTFLNGVQCNQQAKSLCQPGRNVRHLAICDDCERTIYGIRYKCLECPDFDYCASCHDAKKSIHSHRFVPVYEPLAASETQKTRHIGVYCDGPLCHGRGCQSYIQGTRYKCAVCHDLDFCANCEAHPSNEHNKTHPMIMFKTMVQGVSIETHDTRDNRTSVVGDVRPQRPATHRASVATLPRYTTNAQPAEALPAYTPVPPSAPAARPQVPPVTAADLKANFVRDSIPDGSQMQPTQVFQQTWTLHNPGPHVWPAGCSVRHIGGDYMLNVDQNGPSSVAQLSMAQETNVTSSPIMPGQAFNFSVHMKAPTKMGKHISYWRLKSADGTPFGHKLWCDIQVVPAPARVQPQPARQVCWANRDSKLHQDLQMMILGQQNERRSFAEQVMEARLARGVPGRVQSQPPKQSENTESTESTMVFPKLESPASSMHNETPKATSETEAVASPSNATAASTETESLADEVTAKDEFESDSEEDDGFLTDEEYDILDASDEEIIQGSSA